MKRTAFFISDSTGITAEVMGQSLLTHFPDIDFERHSLPYIDTEDKALAAVARINAAAQSDGESPLVFGTLMSKALGEVIATSNAHFIDVISPFLKPLEKLLGQQSSYSVGRPRVATADENYSRRMQAVHYALDNDDGGRIRKYDQADIILVGVSRSGKTPTSLYLAMQFGIFPANYPITEEDLDSMQLPNALRDHKSKLFGLTINADRLAAIRGERLSNSRYASAKQCALEVREVEMLFQRYNIPNVDTTDVSVEEIASRVLSEAGLERRY
jgi:hypothetical protein